MAVIQSRRWAAALLLIVAVSAVAADKPGSTALSFGNWLKNTGSGAVLSTPSYDYDDVDVHHTCLRMFKKKNCIENGNVLYMESELTCCDDADQSKELTLQPTSIGQCDYTYFFLPDITIKPNAIIKWATFFALCHFDKKADECGGPFCDKMVLSVQGDAFTLYNAAAVITQPPALTKENCPDSKRVSGGSREANKVAAKPTSEPYYEHAYEKPGYYDHHPAKALYKTDDGVDVFYGPFTVNSRSHSVKYDQGWFQFVEKFRGAGGIDQGPLIPITEAELGDAIVLDPYTYKLSFVKEKSY